MARRGAVKVALHPYQVVALANLNPSTVGAARSLIPSLAAFGDDEIAQALLLLRRASAKFGEG